MRAQPRRRVVAGARQRRTAAGELGLAGVRGADDRAWRAPPSSPCSPRSPRACACWPRACGRQWGVDGATVNTIAAAPHHWVDAETADTLTRGISLSTPAFGGHGSVADDLAPLIALLDDPDAHFLTAATLVADGGTWVGL